MFRPTSDAKQLEFYEDRGAKSFRTDIRSVKSRNLRDTVAVEPISDCRIAVSKIDEVPKNDVTAIGRAVDDFCAELTGHSPELLVKDKIPSNVSQVNALVDEAACLDGCNGGPKMKAVCFISN